MVQETSIPGGEIDLEARRLAEAHRDFAPSTKEILFFDSQNHDLIRLLEVSPEVPPCEQLFPVSFDPAPGMKYPSVVIVVAQEDFDKLKTGSLSLPQGWGQMTAGRPV